MSFVVLEGIDGCGKDTQRDLLCEYLFKEGKKPVTYDDPGSTRGGIAIRKLLLHELDTPLVVGAQIALFAAARAQVAEEVVRPALKAGKVVVGNRWTSSTMAYQSTVSDKFSQMEIQGICEGIVHLEPDLTIIYDVPVHIAMRRLTPRNMEKDRFESKGINFYTSLADAYRAQPQLAKRTHIIECSHDPPDVIHQKTVSLIEAQLAHFIPPNARLVSDGDDGDEGYH